LNQIYPVHLPSVKNPDLWSGFFTTTAFSFKLSSLPAPEGQAYLGPLGQVRWKNIIGQIQPSHVQIPTG
jgi:hypothetical protein